MNMRFFFVTMFLLLCTALDAQGNKMTITFADGSQKTGMYRFRSPVGIFPQKVVIKSADNREKYQLKEVRNVIVHTDSTDIAYEIIDAKDDIDTRKAEKLLGLVAYRGKNLTLYYVHKAIYQGGTVGMQSAGTYVNAYARRNSDSISFNIGYIYGVAARGLKRRLKKYFTDCPELVEKVENDSIDKEDTAAIVLFFEKHCGK